MKKYRNLIIVLSMIFIFTVAASCFVACNNSQDDKITFGSYPQSEVTDSTLKSNLNAEIQNKKPSSDDANDWTDYGYYLNGSVQSYMWYIDVEYHGAKYRGVYFTNYRPHTTSYSYQSANGYNTNTVYWFKWEPITWRILKQNNGKTLIMADVIIDSQQYCYDTNNRTIEGKNVYSNNYAQSDIRAWLNNSFYNAAFDESSKQAIITTEVNNSSSTTFSISNRYACENTVDNVFLLSYKEVLRSNYGFSTSYSSYDAARRLKPTAYAKCQGAYTSTHSNYKGYGWWLLRSPNLNNSLSANSVHYCGYVYSDYNVNDTSYGVVPALQIRSTALMSV